MGKISGVLIYTTKGHWHLRWLFACFCHKKASYGPNGPDGQNGLFSATVKSKVVHLVHKVHQVHLKLFERIFLYQVQFQSFKMSGRPFSPGLATPQQAAIYAQGHNKNRVTARYQPLLHS